MSDWKDHDPIRNHLRERQDRPTSQHAPRLGSRWNRPDDSTIYVVGRLEDRNRVRLVAEDPDATKHPRIRTTIEAMTQYWTEVPE